MRNQTRKGTETRAPGIFQIKPGLFRLYARRKDPRKSGKGNAKERLFEGTFQDAKRARAQLVLDLETKVEETEKKAKETFAVAAKSWLKLKEPALSAATARGYADALDLHLIPALGDIYIHELTRQDTMRMVNGLKAKRLAYDTIKGKVRVLHNLWGDLRIDDETLKDITHKISIGTKKQADPDDDNSLTPVELDRFLAAWIGHRDEAMINVLADSGQRFCHVSACEWSDFDASNGRIKMMRSQTRQVVAATNVIKRTPGYVPLTPETVLLLHQHRERLMRESHPGLARGLMFPGATGKYKTPASLHKSWIRAIARAGITRPFSVHGLRNTTNDAIMKLSGGETARQMIGHAGREMTLHYSTIRYEDKVIALAKFRAARKGVQS